MKYPLLVLSRLYDGFIVIPKIRRIILLLIYA